MITDKNATNEEFITDLMNFAKSGPMMQVFIVEGMRLYSEQCIAAGAKTFDSGLFNGQLWINCAEEYKREAAARYDR